MKILETCHIREADAYTIEHEPILSIDLMERAATQLFYALEKYFEKGTRFTIFAGPGNNGGDGIALARLLAENGHPVHLFCLEFGNGFSFDAQLNMDRLPDLSWLQSHILTVDTYPEIPENSVIIDALFGSGLTRPLDGWVARIVDKINQSGNQVVALDIPSGLFGDSNEKNPLSSVTKAQLTLSLATPKISFIMPEYQELSMRYLIIITSPL